LTLIFDRSLKFRNGATYRTSKTCNGIADDCSKFCLWNSAQSFSNFTGVSENANACDLLHAATCRYDVTVCIRPRQA